MVIPVWLDLGIRVAVDISALAVVVALGCIVHDYWLRSEPEEEFEDEPCDDCPALHVPETIPACEPVSWEGGW